ncbi:MAG: hypothetical protein QNL92_08425 [Octadecabacter sp.]
MTNIISIWLVVLIIAFFVLDHYVFEMNAFVFLIREFMKLIEYVAFWRQDICDLRLTFWPKSRC